nr:MAG TPA: hypothetical protein [Caudoviricetes sp.]
MPKRYMKIYFGDVYVTLLIHDSKLSGWRLFYHEIISR